MENLNNLTKEENYYYNILEDMLFNGDINESERNILNKRKEEFKISDSRAKELEDFAKLNNSNSRAKELKELEDLIKLNNGDNSYNENNKNSENYELFSESKTPYFQTEGEKDYYELLVDMLEDGIIDESERNILNKRKEKYQISDSRAKELEDIIKDIIKFDNSGSSYENNKDSENNEVVKKTTQKNYNLVDLIGRKPAGVVKKTNYNYFRKQKKESKLNESRNWLLLGNSYNQNGQYKEASECFKKAAKLNPNDADNWFWLGCSYFNNEQYPAAKEAFQKAMGFSPKNYDHLRKRKTKSTPNESRDWLWLGHSYNKNGEYKEAIECYKKVLAIDPNNNEAKKNLEILKSK